MGHGIPQEEDGEHLTGNGPRDEEVSSPEQPCPNGHAAEAGIDRHSGSDATLTESIRRCSTQLQLPHVSPAQSPVSARSASSVGRAVVTPISAEEEGVPHSPSASAYYQCGDLLLAAGGSTVSDPAHISDMQDDGHVHHSHRVQIAEALDDEAWNRGQGSRRYDGLILQSAPPHRVPRPRAVSDIPPRASTASPHIAHQFQVEALEPRLLLHTLQQYHEAIQHTSSRLSAVEADLSRRAVENSVQDHASEGQLPGQFSPIYQRLTRAEETLMRHDDELMAIRASLDRIAARLEDTQSRGASIRPTPRTVNPDEHTTRSPSPRSARTAVHPYMSTPQPRFRPTSMMTEADQRARSVPPLQTGHSSVTGRSDDPPPSFHSRSSDAYHARIQHADARFPPYFGAGDSFDTFDKQAILERGMSHHQSVAREMRSVTLFTGAMLFGLYSLHQLARQTGLQTPLFPPTDTASGN